MHDPFVVAHLIIGSESVCIRLYSGGILHHFVKLVGARCAVHRVLGNLVGA